MSTNTNRMSAHQAGASPNHQGLQERDAAIQHLQAILDPKSTQTEAWQAKQAAKAWLSRNVGVSHA